MSVFPDAKIAFYDKKNLIVENISQDDIVEQMPKL